MRAVLLLLALALGAARAAELPVPVATPIPRTVDPLGKPRVNAVLSQRTISASRQFLVFCPDAAARSQVASYTEEIKTSVLQMLGEPDRWQHNIVVTLASAPAAAGQPPAQLSVYQFETGFKIQIDVAIGSDPSKVNLQRFLVRALLLEFAYRDQPRLLRPGSPYAEAPWWLIEGAMQLYLRRDSGLDVDLFKRIVDVNRLPPIGKFLAGQPSDFNGSAVEAMDQACALCLVQLLLDQSNGRAGLAALLRHWPEGSGDSVAALQRDFGSFAQSEQSLQKWWTLNLARFSAADRYKGLNNNETEAALTAALRLEVYTPGGNDPQPYALAEFPAFVKFPTHQRALETSLNALTVLSATAAELYRPIITEYLECVKLLQHGKTRGLKSRVAKIDQVRADLRQRMTGIADYLNWVEATQTNVRSGKFDGYLKAAQELSEPSTKQDPLSRYMDEQARRLKEADLPTKH